MSNLGERIKYLRRKILRLNQAAFAETLGISRAATISNFEKNKRDPDITILCKISDIGNVSLDWLLTGEGIVSAFDDSGKEAGPGFERGGKDLLSLIKIDVFDRSNAGSPKEFPMGDPVDIFCIHRRDYDKNILALRHRGDCMSPNILDGATVGVDLSDMELLSGKVYAVWLGSEGVTFRRVYVYPDKVVLKPDNPTFPETDMPTRSEDGDFILGSVKWVFQKY